MLVDKGSFKLQHMQSVKNKAFMNHFLKLSPVINYIIIICSVSWLGAKLILTQPSLVSLT